MTSTDDFYVGYEPHMPAGLRRTVRRTVIAAAALLVAAALAATCIQRPLADARFEYGAVRKWSGWLSVSPTPMLHVHEGGEWRRYWMVGPGKFGLAAIADVQAYAGPVTLDATLIAREHWQMLEVVPGSIRRRDGGSAPPPRAEPTRTRVRLDGEVVDSKCFLGVMNPGQGAAHRDCAERCLSGGVPRMFAYHDDAGRLRLALLVGHHHVHAGVRTALAGDLIVDGDVEVLVVEVE